MIQRLLFVILIAFITLTTFSMTVEAHADDVSAAYFYLHEDWNFNEVANNEIAAAHTFNFQQASLALGFDETVSSFDEYEQELIEYLQSNIQVSNSQQDCYTSEYDLLTETDPELIELGVTITYKITCANDISDLYINDTVLTDVVATQHNFIAIFSKPDELIESVNLGSEVTDWRVDLSNVTDSELVDESPNIFFGRSTKITIIILAVIALGILVYRLKDRINKR
ncbi:hypothetical protein KC909_06830 [Candidatus Dojkabacteria bacterium]|uniref:Uncharacterized protein n=1 Tax=Candidatus Dojkabacteria bacterium TaxID=2099670 RepID=A0A955L7E5_9BACT|nr:hypothetical protein [Candidatus Dojkabacteria bacterium]